MYFGNNFTRILFFIISLFFAVGTIFYAGDLFQKIAKEEEEEVKLFAQALKNVSTRTDEDLNIYWSILQMNKNVPILIFDEKEHLVQHTNIELKPEDFKLSKEALLKKEGINGKPIKIQLRHNKTQFIYYGHSPTLQILQYIPFVQLLLMFLLIILGYTFYKGVQQSHQNNLWAGFSKETAHQLGTPISSLIGWVELLKEGKVKSDYLTEMSKDLERLSTVSDRFSNIGSIPEKKTQNIIPIIEGMTIYMKSRISESIQLTFEKSKDALTANVNKELLNWVIENLIKNAVDAISGQGKVTIKVSEISHKIYIDTTDTGKGIPSNLVKKVFQPGYSTKKRGWGLGLSFVKRIIKDYHNGRIFVKNTEVDKGTTFRIVLPKK